MNVVHLDSHRNDTRKNCCLRLASLVVAMMVLASASSAWAQGTRAMAVLNIEGQGGVSRDTADTLSAVVRNEAQQIVTYQVINATPINLSEVVMVLGCDVTSTPCLQQAAQQLDAKILIYGSLKREAQRYLLKLEIFDAQSGQVTHRMQEVIGKDDDLVFVSRQEIEKFFKQIRQDQIAAKLTITSNVRGATVLLNGEPVGTTPLEKTGIAPGSYTITVRMEGFTDWSAEMELGEKADMKLRAPLQKKPAAITPPGETNGAVASGGGNTGSSPTLGDGVEIETPRRGVNVGAISLLAVGGVALGASGLTAMRMNALSRQLTQQVNDGSISEQEREDGIKRGYNLQFTHRLLLGAGALSAAAGVVWLLVDDAEPGPNERATRWQLGVSPTGVTGRVQW